MRLLQNFAIYLVIIGGVLYGLPRGLAYWLGTPYPLAAITSNSMWPVLAEGDLVLIEGVEMSELKVGDIVVYRQTASPGFTIHRVTVLNTNSLVTKGDANFEPDAPVAYNQVVGRSVILGGRPAHLPYLGSLTMLASRWREKK